MRCWFLAVKVSMEMGISWQNEWAVGDDVTVRSNQARDLLPEHRWPGLCVWASVQMSVISGSLSFVNPQRGLRAILAETGSSLRQHRAEEIDRGYLRGETQCAVCALKGKVSPQDPYWYLGLYLSSENVSGVSSQGSPEGMGDIWGDKAFWIEPQRCRVFLTWKLEALPSCHLT